MGKWQRTDSLGGYWLCRDKGSPSVLLKCIDKGGRWVGWGRGQQTVVTSRRRICYVQNHSARQKRQVGQNPSLLNTIMFLSCKREDHVMFPNMTRSAFVQKQETKGIRQELWFLELVFQECMKYIKEIDMRLCGGKKLVTNNSYNKPWKAHISS